MGYDRWAFELTQTAPRLTTPTDTLLQVVMNQRGKISILYFTTLNTAFGHAVEATLTAGFNHYHLDGSDAASSGTPTIVGTLGGSPAISRLPSSNSGYFAQGQIGLADAVFLTAGVRAESSPGFGEDLGVVISSRFGVSYVRPFGSVMTKLRASYGEGIRAPEPSQNQPFLTVGFERLHNPALGPERQRGGDGGIDLQWSSRASLSATYYSQHAIDLIDQVYGDIVGDPPRQQIRQENIGRISNHGWEIEARYNLERLQMSGALSVTYSRIQRLDPAYGGDYRVGDRLFDVPRHSAGITVAYSPTRNTILHGEMTNVGNWVERDLIAFYGALFAGVPRRPSDRDYWITYPGFTKFRAGIEQTIRKGLRGTFNLENITNNRAFETYNLAVPAPRTFTLALHASY